MKLYKVTISPKSSFGTTLRGDTIFGHICWIIKYKYGNKKLNQLLDNYKNKRPFLIVSDGFVSDYLPKPKMPSFCLGEDPAKKKENRKKIWLKLEDLINAEFKNAKREDEIVESKNKEKSIKDKEESIIKNSLNYLTFTTDKGNFAPYANKEYFFNEKDIYFLLDEEQLSYKEFKEILDFFTLHGYGKDITIGKGRFEIKNITKIDNINLKSKYYMSLSPFILLENEQIENAYYEPFIRFGKFGGEWAFYNPFKRPIMFLDTASVIVFKEEREIKFFGGAVKDIALSDNEEQKNSVQQGYTILLPLKDIKCKQ